RVPTSTRFPYTTLFRSQRRQGVMKDTARNAIEIGAFVIHITDEAIIEKVNATAASLPAHESEVTLAGFTPVASESIVVPGVKERSEEHTSELQSRENLV